MTKKIIGFMCAILTLTSISIKNVNAAKYIEYPVVVGEVDNFKPELPENDAQSAYLCDYNSGTVVYAKNENDRRPIASMTKIMLLLLAFEKEANGEFSLDENIKVSSNASGMGGSQVFLEADKEYRAEELIKSIIVASANDSSVAIAERLFGSESVAVHEMNKRAEKLGLKNTLFSNCTGLMKPTQYSSAKDVAKMLSELIKYEKYFNYSKIYLENFSHGDRVTQMTNTNKLVRFYNGCDGGKTGFTNEAGFCLAATAKRGATRLISVVIGEKDSKKRFADVSKLFDYGFDNYSSKCVLATDCTDYQVEVKKGKSDYTDAVPENNIYIFGLNNAKENVRIVFEPDEICAPIKKGDTVGTFTVYNNDIKIGEYNAVSGLEIERAEFSDYLNDIAVA